MIILGLATTPSGDAAAALVDDQRLVVACDEAGHSQRLPDRLAFPVTAVQTCLQQAGLHPRDIDAVAIADAGLQTATPAFWHQLARQWQASPWHAAGGLIQNVRHYQQLQSGWRWLLTQLGIDPQRTQQFRVERTLAQAHAGIVAAGHPQSTCVLSCNDTLSPTAALFGRTNNGRFERLSEIAQPDSLMQVMRCMGAYLGFEAHHALEGIALLARHGDPDRYNLNRLFTLQGDRVQINLQLLTPDTQRGWRYQGKRYPFTPRLLDWLGPPAAEAPALDPHAHYAAALHRYFWQTLQRYFIGRLGGQLKQTPTILLCGDAALARHVPDTLQENTGVALLQRSPFTGSKGAAIGAAAHVAALHGILLDKLEHPFLGPGFLQEECIAACRKHASQPAFDIIRDPAKKAARLIAEGHAVGWLQGRSEAGTLALGARAILQSPLRTQRPLAVAIQGNQWTDIYCPVLSVSATHIDRYCKNPPADAFATQYVDLTADACEWLPGDLQIDGKAPVHRVDKAFSQRLFTLLEELEKISGHGMVLQLPMQHAAGPRACSPCDALDWFVASDASHLIMEEVWVRKTK